MELNEIDEIVVPEVPKVIPDQELFVYVPIGSYDTAGIVSFDPTYFIVDEGHVALQTINIVTNSDLPVTSAAVNAALTVIRNDYITVEQSNTDDATTLSAANTYTDSQISTVQSSIAYIEANYTTNTNLYSTLSNYATIEYVASVTATASANFRGQWKTWSDVPTNDSLFPVDALGNHTPKTNDYLTVANASDYHGEERFTTQGATNGYIIGTSGIISESSGCSYTKLIAIDNKDKYIRFSIPQAPAYTFNVHGYTEDGVWVAKLIEFTGSETSEQTALVEIPSTVKAIKVSYATTYISGLSVKTEQLVGVWRFKYVGIWTTDGKDGFMPEYQVNEEPFTQAQQDAINSGATAAKILAIDNKVDRYAGTGSRVYATNNGVDTPVTYATAANVNTLAYRTTGGRLNVGEPVSDGNAATKKYVDTAVAGASGGMTIGCTSSEYCGYYIPELSMGIDIQDAYFGMEAGKSVQYYDSINNIHYNVVSAKKNGDAYSVSIACGNYLVIEYTYGTDFNVSRTFAFIRNGVDSTQPSDIIVEVEPETERNLGVVDGYIQILFRNTSNEPNPIWSIDFTTNSNEPSITLSGLTIKWVGGEPTFEASKGYTIMVKKVGSTYIGVWGDYEL